MDRTCYTLACAVITCLTGCGATPITHGQVATVQGAVQACTLASSGVTANLKAGDRQRARQAAVAARNTCSAARSTITQTVGNRLPDCRAAVDLQTRTQVAELKALDDNATPAEVVAVLDQAIAAQRRCGGLL
jgi:hypothetical protein